MNHINKVYAAADNQNPVLSRAGIAYVMQGCFDIANRPKKDRTINADNCLLWAILVGEAVAGKTAIAFFWVRGAADNVWVWDTNQMQDQWQHYTNINGEGQLDKNRRKKGGCQHGGIGAAGDEDGLDGTEIY